MATDPRAHSYFLDPGNRGGQGEQGTAMGPDPFGLRQSGRSMGLDRMGEGAQDRSIGGDVRGQQMDAFGMLSGIASGQAPSAAQMQMQQGLGLAQAQQIGASKAIRGGHMGAVNAGLQQGLGATQLGGIQQMAQLRAQEQQGALQSLTQGLGGVRGADIQAQSANDAMTRYFLQLGYSMDEANRMAEIQRMQMAQGYDLGTQQIGQQNLAAGLNVLGTGLAAGGEIGASLLAG